MSDNKKLEWALWWAAQGFRVFPLAVNSKIPAFKKDENDPNALGPPEYATRDEAQIRAWWSGTAYNIGVIADEHVLADLDQKPDPKTGVARDGFTDYMMAVGNVDTLIVRTTSVGPTGIPGRHLYFSGPAVSNSGWGGVDIRSGKGYLVGAGSAIDGREYEIERLAPVAPAPAALLAKLRTARTADEHRDAPLGDLDTPAALARGREVASTYEAATPGSRGITAYKLGAKLRDEGVSEDTAAELAVALWAPRCEPPPADEETRAAVSNAYRYAQNRPGARSPEIAFSGVHVQAFPIAPPAAGDVPGVGHNYWAQFGNLVPAAALKPRPWTYRGFLLRGDATALVAPGGMGKSTIVLSLAAHAAYGLDFLTFRNAQPNIPRRTMVYNAEDSVEEMSNRMHACCAVYGFDPITVSRSVVLVSGKEKRFKIMRKEGTANVLQIEDVRELIRTALENEVSILGLDPLVKLHECNENSNVEMGLVMDAVEAVAQAANVAVLLAHHTAKPPSAMASSFAGSADAGRGAGAIRDSVRILTTLMGPKADDLMRFGMPASESRKYLRLDGAKSNVTLLGEDEPIWLEKQTVKLHTGEEIGVFLPADLAERGTDARQSLARTIREVLTAAGATSIALHDAASAVCARDPIYAKAGVIATRGRLERFLAEPVAMHDGMSIGMAFDKTKKVIRMT